MARFSLKRKVPPEGAESVEPEPEPVAPVNAEPVDTESVSPDPEQPVRAAESAPKPEETVVVTAPPFTEDTRIERGLMALAANNGNARKASKFLAEDGIEVPHQTLWRWANKVHADRYEEMRADALPKVRAQAADAHMDLMTRNMELEADLLEDLKENRHKLEPRDMSTAARNAAVGTAIHTDKAQLLNDQPTEIRNTRDVTELLRALKDRAPGLFIEGTVVSEETITPYAPEEEEDGAAA
jgi:hypothetical protein